MTILEVLIALTVFAVVALVVFAAFGIGLRATTLAGGMQTATSLAEEALAQLAASPCGASFESALPPLPDRADLARYRREARADRVPGADLWALTVTVSWTQERAARSVTLTTLRHVSAACAAVGP
jgi:hypothetical protein